MEITKVDTDLLRFFKVMMETQSLTHTANHMGLSLASASRHLARLREVFQDDLFIRTRHGMTASARAIEIFPQLLEALASLNALLSPTQFTPEELRGIIKIGTPDNGVFAILSSAICELVEKAPHLKLELVTLGNTLYEHIENGTIDLAVYPIASLPPDFHECLLFTDPFACVVRKEHPLARYTRLGKIPPSEEVAQYGRVQVTVRGDRNVDAVGISLYPECQQKTVLWTPYFLSIPFILTQSNLTATIPRRTALYFSKIAPLTILPSPKPGISYTTRIIWHHRTHKNPTIRWVRDLIIKHAKDPFEEQIRQI